MDIRQVKWENYNIYWKCRNDLFYCGISIFCRMLLGISNIEIISGREKPYKCENGEYIRAYSKLHSPTNYMAAGASSCHASSKY